MAIKTNKENTMNDNDTRYSKILEELAEAFEAIDNGGLKSAVYTYATQVTQAINGLNHDQSVRLMKTLHGLGGQEVVKFISENQDEYQRYSECVTLIKELKKCNQ